MQLLEAFGKYGTYNAWMNTQLVTACEAIPDAKRKEDLGAFFGSIHATLVHILVCDKMRMHQFDPGNPYWPGACTGEDFDDWSVFCRERRACDAAIMRWLDTSSYYTPSDVLESKSPG